MLVGVRPSFREIFKMESFYRKYFMNGFLVIPNKSLVKNEEFGVLVYESGDKYAKRFKTYLKRVFSQKSVQLKELWEERI